MRFLADENFSGPAVVALREAGHDVAWVRDAIPGANDADVLAAAVREKRILLTFDKEFGELAGGMVVPPECGVLLVRMPTPKPGDLNSGKRLAALITGRTDWAGHFSVLEPGRVRMRPLG